MCQATAWNHFFIEPTLKARQAQNAENPSINLQRLICISKTLNYILLFPIIAVKILQLPQPDKHELYTGLLTYAVTSKIGLDASNYQQWLKKQTKLQEQKQDKSI